MHAGYRLFPPPEFEILKLIFSNFSDSLTLQLWKDRSDAERNPPTKGSIALEGYLGWEAGFTLDRESLTLAVVLRDAMVTLAFDARETMMRWQVSESGMTYDL